MVVIWFFMLVIEVVYPMTLWPKPTMARFDEEQLVTINTQPESYMLDLQAAPNVTHLMLKIMAEVAFYNIRAECGKSVALGQKQVVIQINVKTSEKILTWNSSEEYNLVLLNSNDSQLLVQISADTVYGARHALETFTQLVSAKKTYDNKCLINIVSSATITDKPEFKHRGLLLDTARNFFHINHIKRTLDGMAASKLNVFHWHIMDFESFPLKSIRVPKLTRYGAFSASEVYTIGDIQEIAIYAQIRGIRVVLEIEGPAHVYRGWRWGKDKKAIKCSKINGQLNLANPSIYKVLRLLYREIAENLPKPVLLHMGGDGVEIKCWKKNKKIISYMKTRGISRKMQGFHLLWAQFHEKTLKIWDDEHFAAGGKKHEPVMLWSSNLTNSVYAKEYLSPKRYVIELTDDNAESAQKLMRLGYRIVAAPQKTWYLSHGFWGKTNYSTWDQIYSHTLPSNPNMLGGEVAVWSDHNATDESTLDSRIWPRAAAFAERMWSNTKSTDPVETKERLEGHRIRLVTRGLNPSTLMYY